MRFYCVVPGCTAEYSKYDTSMSRRPGLCEDHKHYKWRKPRHMFDCKPVKCFSEMPPPSILDVLPYLSFTAQDR